MRSNLERSIARLKVIHDGSIVLNPTENIPIEFKTMANYAFVQGMYVTDQLREDLETVNPKIIFGGRTRHVQNVRKIQDQWAKLLGAKALSFRLLSGLHMYMALFMSIGHIGDSVLVLPEDAGGHFSVGAILHRLGYRILYMDWDSHRRCVDIEKTNAVIKRKNPRFILMDRSEGLNYEDMTHLNTSDCDLAVFDASQYLSNILAGDFKNPFDMGFNAIVATIHKNFPGPQKAFVAFKEKSSLWHDLQAKLRLYVSNTHVYNTYMAGLSLANMPLIKRYSHSMLKTAKVLAYACEDCGLDNVEEDHSNQRTHHIWLSFPDKQRAFDAYKKLEWNRILVNYRLLPYDLGYGLRLGTAWAVLMGLTPKGCRPLAQVIADCVGGKSNLSLRHHILEIKRSWTPLVNGLFTE